jgi:hypothetical protein
MQRSPLRRSVEFLAFSIVVALIAFSAGDTLTMAVRDLVHPSHASPGSAMKNPLKGGNTCVVFRFVAS